MEQNESNECNTIDCWWIWLVVGGVALVVIAIVVGVIVAKNRKKALQIHEPQPGEGPAPEPNGEGLEDSVGEGDVTVDIPSENS